MICNSCIVYLHKLTVSKHLWLYSYHSLNVRKTATAKCCWFRNQPIVCDTIVVQVAQAKNRLVFAGFGASQ